MPLSRLSRKNQNIKKYPAFAPPAAPRFEFITENTFGFNENSGNPCYYSGMQIRYPTEQTPDEYVRTEAWKFIRVVRCPIHPDSDCRVTRHGTYPRDDPKGTKILRILCHTGHGTFSLLPDCFSSRFPGTLADLEGVVLMVETAVRNSGHDEFTMTAAQKVLTSPDLTTVAEESAEDGRLFGADLRWLKRRIGHVIAVLSAVVDLFPEKFGNCRPTLGSFRSVLGPGPVLIRLRALAESRIHEIPSPVGLNPRFAGPQDPECKPP